MKTTRNLRFEILSKVTSEVYIQRDVGCSGLKCRRECNFFLKEMSGCFLTPSNPSPGGKELVVPKGSFPPWGK